jgi:hypothetical protein
VVRGSVIPRLPREIRSVTGQFGVERRLAFASEVVPIEEADVDIARRR